VPTPLEFHRYPTGEAPKENGKKNATRDMKTRKIRTAFKITD
jgi:hypothetical protein